jgi:hypothetical protein
MDSPRRARSRLVNRPACAGTGAAEPAAATGIATAGRRHAICSANLRAGSSLPGGVGLRGLASLSSSHWRGRALRKARPTPAFAFLVRSPCRRG